MVEILVDRIIENKKAVANTGFASGGATCKLGASNEL